MPQAIPVPKRKVIVERHERGESLKAIAEDMEESYWTVRHIWRRCRDRGEEGLQPDYDRCGRKGVQGSQLVYRASVMLKRRHPTWGAPLIRLLIMEKWPEEEVPHERTLQRWFRAAGLNKRVKQRIPGQQQKRGSLPHEVWQMDAKERIKLADGSQASWLLLSDEKTGAILEGKVFPPGGVDTGETGSGTG